jgi:hypothetical protein
MTMPMMQSIAATWLICFLWAWSSRAIHGFTTIQNCGGGGGIGSPKLDQKQLVHRATPKRDSLDELKVLALARLLRCTQADFQSRLNDETRNETRLIITTK